VTGSNELNREESSLDFPNTVEWLGECDVCWGLRIVDNGYGEVKVGCSSCLGGGGS